MTEPICSICFESLLTKISAAAASCLEDVSVSALSCGHVFHSGCVSSWVSSHSECPQCRQRTTSCSKLYLTEDKTKTLDKQEGHNSEDYRIVLDVLQTQLEDHEKENKKLRISVFDVEREKEEEAARFQIQVEKLQQQFKEVERRVRTKDATIQELIGRLEGHVDGKGGSSYSERESERMDGKGGHGRSERDNERLYRSVKELEDLIQHKNVDLRQKEGMVEDLRNRNRGLESEMTRIGRELNQARRQMEAEHGETMTVYESLDDDMGVVTSHGGRRKRSCWKQLSSCLRCTLVIVFAVGLVIALLIVLPLKILLTQDRY